MQQFLFILAAFGIGGMIATYLSINTMVAGKVGSPEQATLPYFLLAFLLTLGVFLFRGSTATLGKFAEVPWWALLTGLAGGASVILATFLIGEIGPDRYFVAGVAGQVVMAVLLAHYAWLGTEHNALNWQKGLGIAFSILGVLLVSLGNAASAVK